MQQLQQPGCLGFNQRLAEARSLPTNCRYSSPTDRCRGELPQDVAENAAEATMFLRMSWPSKSTRHRSAQHAGNDLDSRGFAGSVRARSRQYRPKPP